MQILHLNKDEIQLVQILRTLKPYEKVEIKLVDNQTGKMQIIITRLEKIVVESYTLA